MTRVLKNILFFVTIGCIGVGCNTDFELNAPYQPIPIIYGLLDQSADTQFVKINKSFLGDGNNVNYAGINDSVLFNTVSASVVELQNNVPINTYNLQELWVDNLEDGLFYEDSQKVYFFIPTAPLNDQSTYQLNIETDEVGQPITAETNLIDGAGLSFDFLFGLSLGLNGLQLADVDLGTNNVYYDPQVRWVTSKNGKRYELLMKFNYNEVKTTSSEIKSIYWKLSSQTSISTDGQEDMFKKISGEAFFEMIYAALDGYEDEPDVVKREIRGVEFIVSAGNEDLNTYIEVNEPATGVVTERPSFTNINGGIGLFGSKYQVSIAGPLSDGTVLELCMGQVTGGFKFCCDSTDQVTTISNLTGGVNVSCN